MNSYPTQVVAIGLLLSLSFVVISCTEQNKNALGSPINETDQAIQLSLQEKISINPELQIALDHFNDPQDSLKRKALLFLIENVDNKKGVSAQMAKAFLPIYSHIFSLGETNGVDNRNIAIDPSIYEQIKQKEEAVYYADLYNLTADLLIENIDYAFKAWRFPWARHLSFKEFCNYILPYRILNEPLTPWRKYLFEKNRKLITELGRKGITDPVAVCKLLNDILLKRFVFYSKINAPYLPIEDLDQYPAGDCLRRYLLFTAIARTLGLPVAIDFTPQYPRYPGSHEWTVLINDGNGKILAFNGGDKWSEYPFIGYKIYRNTFRNYPRSQEEKGVLPYLFTNPNFIDVSAEYPYDVFDYSLSLNDSLNGQEVYLFTFGIGSGLVPMARGKVTNGHAVFKDMIFREEGLVVLASYNDGVQKILENPIIVKKDYEPWVYTPSEQVTRKIRLKRKYTISPDMYGFAEHVKEASIQGANRKDFKDAVTLYTYEDVPQFYQLVNIDSPSLLRYYRYIPKKGRNIYLAELKFFYSSDDSDDSTCLPYQGAKYISSLPDALLHNVFDNSIRSNLNAEAGNWIGIDLGENNKRRLCRVGVLPRNNWNVIENGHKYELFYFDKGWKSLGIKTAKDFYLDFDNAPHNAVMILHDLTEGRQERIFTYSNDWQLFW